MKAVVVCPGRGTYGKTELGSLMLLHRGKPVLQGFEALRTEAGQEGLAALDRAAGFEARHTRGDNASQCIGYCPVIDTK